MANQIVLDWIESVNAELEQVKTENLKILRATKALMSAIYGLSGTIEGLAEELREEQESELVVLSPTSIAKTDGELTREDIEALKRILHPAPRAERSMGE